ncbi:manganese superoxide dismutase [Imleria badia]|nr:manganese superoxide dismutase [Imleria badia]
MHCHINHSLFWTNLAPSAAEGKGNGGALRDAPLKEVDTLKKDFNATTAAIQGSGWRWVSKTLEIVTTANQDPLLSHVAIIGVDIWEHAFYLQYLNVKVDYLNVIWNVINFEEAERRYVEASGASKL